MRSEFFAGVVLGLILGAVIGVLVAASTVNHRWAKDAIDRGLARYAPTTAQFEWLELDNPRPLDYLTP